jgi:MFS family permease
MVSGFFDRELGFSSVLSSHSKRDIFLLYASRFIRLFAFGAVTPILVLHLRLMSAYLHTPSVSIADLFIHRADIPDELVGLFLSLTLVGDVVLSLIVTWVADSLGRRNVLAGGAGLMLIAGVTFALSENYLVLLFAAVVGVISRVFSIFSPLIQV